MRRFDAILPEEITMTARRGGHDQRRRVILQQTQRNSRSVIHLSRLKDIHRWARAIAGQLG